MSTTTTLSVPEISCDHCKHSIEGAVGTLTGVESVNVEIEPKTVHFTYDESVLGLEQVRSAIEAVGYEVPDQS